MDVSNRQLSNSRNLSALPGPRQGPPGPPHRAGTIRIPCENIFVLGKPNACGRRAPTPIRGCLKQHVTSPLESGFGKGEFLPACCFSLTDDRVQIHDDSECQGQHNHHYPESAAPGAEGRAKRAGLGP